METIQLLQTPSVIQIFFRCPSTLVWKLLS